MTDLTATKKIDPHRSGMVGLFMSVTWQLDNSKIRGTIEEDVINRHFIFAF